MKYLIILLSLGICSTFFWQPVSFSTQDPSCAAIVDELVRQTEKSEDEVRCLAEEGIQKVLYLKHRWLVNEYSSGKLETIEVRDTVWVEELPFGRPCPGTLVELSLR